MAPHSDRQRPPSERHRARTEPIDLLPPAATPLSSMVWRIEEGPGRGQEFRVEGDATTIGTAPGSGIRLEDPTVSAAHAMARSTTEGVILTDLGSRNGTHLEGARIREAFLGPGARVRVGRTLLVLTDASAGAPGPDVEECLEGMYALSPVMRRVFAILRRVATGEVTVILTGETGTGKDVAARAIHKMSNRSNRPFVVLDCSALDRDLVSAELFGHEAGAFTGAVSARPGAFEQAHRGTLFLDEVGELPLDLQPKLLRALEQREVKRLGGTKTCSFDCRIIAATHRDLARMVQEGRFREDLFYRLSQMVICLPPLRERREDIPLLAKRILDQLHTARGGPGKIDPAAMNLLASLPHPGNVRELKNLVERAHLMATGHVIEVTDIQVTKPRQDSSTVPFVSAPGTVTPTGPRGRLEEAERETILQALKDKGFNRVRAAAELGISLPTLRKRIRQYGIPIPGSFSTDPEDSTG